MIAGGHSKPPPPHDVLATVAQKLGAALELVDQMLLSIEPRDSSEEFEHLIEARQQIAIAISLVRRKLNSS